MGFLSLDKLPLIKWMWCLINSHFGTTTTNSSKTMSLNSKQSRILQSKIRTSTPWAWVQTKCTSPKISKASCKKVWTTLASLWPSSMRHILSNCLRQIMGHQSGPSTTWIPRVIVLLCMGALILMSRIVHTRFETIKSKRFILLFKSEV